jgi:hypothetical protein
VASFSNPPFADSQSAQNHRFRSHAALTGTRSDGFFVQTNPLNVQKAAKQTPIHNLKWLIFGELTLS